MENEGYNEAEDPDYEDELADGVSALGMDDDLTYDTNTVGYQSAAFKAEAQAKEEGVVPKKKRKRIYGNTTIGLPYILDIWRDSKNNLRFSLQIQMLSGKEEYKNVIARVSTSQHEVVLYIPMSEYMSRSDFAFHTFLLDDKKLTDTEVQCLILVLKHHSKSSARMLAVSKIKGRSSTDGFYYEQRIPLPRKANHQFAVQTDGDEFFFGRKFVLYPNGEVFMHLELLADFTDGYCPTEVQSVLVTRVASAMAGVGLSSVAGTAMDTEPIKAVLDSYEPAVFDGRGAKRTRSNQPTQPPAQQQQQQQRTLMEEVAEEDVEYKDSIQGDDDDAETVYSQKTIDAARARAAALLAQVNQQEVQLKQASSLQAAAKAGKMGPHQEEDDGL